MDRFWDHKQSKLQSGLLLATIMIRLITRGISPLGGQRTWDIKYHHGKGIQSVPFTDHHIKWIIKGGGI